MKPILFSTPMVQAILAEQKTMTRRVILKLPEGTYRIDTEDGREFFSNYGRSDVNVLFDLSELIKPKYNINDVLWVRETWRVDGWHEDDGEINVQFKADGYSDPRLIPIENEDLFDRLWIQCSEDAEKAGLKYNEDNGQYFWEDGQGPCRWRPSIFMPKEAARIFLRVTDVRAERLQDISVVDVMAEGLPCDNEINNPDQSTHDGIKAWNLAYAQHLFRELWDSLNAARGYGWYTNPWVWVYEFERITREEAERG